METETAKKDVWALLHRRVPGRHRSTRANRDAGGGRWADRDTMREVCRPGSRFTFLFLS